MSSGLELTLVEQPFLDQLVLMGWKLVTGSLTHPSVTGRESFREVAAKDAGFPIEKAIKGMLPKNVLGREMLLKLKVYGSDKHPHTAQKPEALSL